jgi:hypothetical protein
VSNLKWSKFVNVVEGEVVFHYSVSGQGRVILDFIGRGVEAN